MSRRFYEGPPKLAPEEQARRQAIAQKTLERMRAARGDDPQESATALTRRAWTKWNAARVPPAND